MTIPARDLAPYETFRVTRGTLFYLFCLTIISVTYYMYWWLLQLKVYYLGWGVCLLMAVAMSLANHLRTVRIARDMFPLLVWFAYIAGSALWSPSPRTTLYFLWADLVTLIAFMVSYAWIQSTSEWKLSGFFELQALLILPIVVWFIATVGELYAKGFGSVRTVFAANCLIALPFLVWRQRTHPNAKTLITLVLALGLLIAGESRTALLTTPVLLIGALFFVGESRHGRARTFGLVFGILSVFLVAIAVLPAFREALMHSLGRFGGEGHAGTSFSISSAVLEELRKAPEDRVDIARRLQLFIALKSFLAQPLIGGGYQSTVAIIKSQFGMEVGAHGLPATLLGETGIVGTVIFIWMIARFYRRVNYANSLTTDSVRRGFLSTCKLTMLGVLLLGLFHQVHEMPATFVLLAWGYSLPPPP